MDIEAYMDHALINGQRVDRPAHICRSEWMKFWEKFSRRYYR